MDYEIHVIMGRVAAEPKLTPEYTTPDGKTVQARLNFTTIVNKWWAKDKKTRNHTSYPCTIWGPLAVTMLPLLKTGKSVTLELEDNQYAAGTLAEKPGQKINGWSFTVKDIVLGHDSMKNGGSHSIIKPEMLAAIEAVAAKMGLDISALINMPAQVTEEAAPAEQAAATGAGETNTPF
jgi:hypothetical protein